MVGRSDSGDLRTGGETRHELSDLKPEHSSEPDWKEQRRYDKGHCNENAPLKRGGWVRTHRFDRGAYGCHRVDVGIDEERK